MADTKKSKVTKNHKVTPKAKPKAKAPAKAKTEAPKDFRVRTTIRLEFVVRAKDQDAAVQAGWDEVAGVMGDVEYVKKGARASIATSK